MPDPTAQTMRAYLRTLQDGVEPDADASDREEAIYWFANDYHGGQWSNLYAALSTSTYRPGPSVNGPEPESQAEYLYEALVAAYAHTGVA